MSNMKALRAVVAADNDLYQSGLARLLPLLIAALLIVVLMLGARSSGLHSVSSDKSPMQTAGSASAEPSSEDSVAQQNLVLERLAALGFEDVSLAIGHKPGWYTVSTHQGLYYMDVEGNFLLAGQWFSVANPDAVINLTEQANARMRMTQLAQHQSSAIVYGDSSARYQVSVFTDHTCGYCRRMHQMLDEYLAADFAIHYYAFPRAGAQSQGAEQLAAIWCADDKQAALDDAKLESDTAALSAPSEACSNQVAEHLQMGRAMGVQGTPAIILPDGRLISGFRPVDVLITEIEQNASEQ